MKVWQTESGWPGHLCVSDKCIYHRHTKLERSDGVCVRVSTVGAYKSDYVPKGHVYETIGYQRYYETYIFVREWDQINPPFESRRAIAEETPPVEEIDEMHDDNVMKMREALLEGWMPPKEEEYSNE